MMFKFKISVLLGILIVAVQTASLHGDDWSAYKYESARSAATGETAMPRNDPAAPLVLHWSAQLNGAWLSAPIVVSSRIFIGSADGSLHTMNVNDGSVSGQWAYPTNGYVRTIPAYYKGRVYFGSSDGYLYCVHAGTGQLLWRTFHGGTQMSSPLVVNDRVFVGVGDPSLEFRAYNFSTGSPLWSYSMGQPVYSSPVYHSGKVIVGSESGKWVALNESTGAKVWEYHTITGPYLTTPAVEGDRVILAVGTVERSVIALDANSGSELWKVVPVPGAGHKPGEAAGGKPNIIDPASMVPPDVLDQLMNLSKAERDDYLDKMGQANKVDYTPLKNYLDLMLEPAPSGGGSGKPSGGSSGNASINLSLPVRTSSPVISGGRVFVTQREMSGTGNDTYITYCMDAANGSILWNTFEHTIAGADEGFVPDPVITGNSYVYIPFGTEIYVYDLNGNTFGTIDAGSTITASLVIANGKLYAVTPNGLYSYTTGNMPPTTPTAFTPSGGTNITGNSTPTLSWGGALDPEAGALRSELQIGIGTANSDLELLETAPVSIIAGVQSYPIPNPVSSNTRVFWRVRSRDPLGAYSAWSATQDFWVNRDTAAPSPPENVIATALNNAVQLQWTPSPSSDVVAYTIYYTPTGQPMSGALSTSVDSSVTTTIIDGLANNTRFNFMITAKDAGDNESAGVMVSATPIAPISINGGAIAYATLQAAINAASSGDYIHIGVGTFSGPITLKAGVSLRGTGAGLTHLNAAGAAVGIHVEASGSPSIPVEITDLSITGGLVGIDVGSANVTIKNVLIYEMGGDAIQVGAAGSAEVINVTLVGNLGDGIDSAGSSLSVRNTIFSSNQGYGIHSPAGVTVRYNDFYNNVLGMTSGGVTLETGNLTARPLFTNEANDDYSEKSASPTVDAGDPADDYSSEPQPNGGRINMGAFGNKKFATKSAPTVHPSPSPRPHSDGGGGGGGGGGCGSIGLDLMAPLGLLWLIRNRRRFSLLQLAKNISRLT